MTRDAWRRMDDIHKCLTPKQYVLLWLDEIRGFPSYTAYYEATLNTPMREQTAIQIVENCCEVARLRAQSWDPMERADLVKRSLRDLAFLKRLIEVVNGHVHDQLATIRPQTASVAKWLQLRLFHQNVSDDVEGLVELVSHLSEGKSGSGSAKLSAKLRALVQPLEKYRLPKPVKDDEEVSQGSTHRALFPAYVEELREVRDGNWALLRQIYRTDRLVKTLSRKYFGHHPILFPEHERALSGTIHWFEQVVEEYNAFANHAIEPLAGENVPTRGQTSSGRRFGDRWVIDLSQVREAASEACQAFVVLIEDLAREFALMSIGETGAAGRIFAPGAYEDPVTIVQRALADCRP